MVSFMSSFKNSNLTVPEQRIFVWITASVADTTPVNPNGIKTLLANGFGTIFIKDKPVFSNDARSLSENPPNFTILGKLVFHNFILADALFSKVLGSFETCVLVNNNLCGKLLLLLELPIKLDLKLLQYQFLFLILIY